VVRGITQVDKKVEKNNEHVGWSVAMGLPFVARILPSDYPSTAWTLPECYLQLAELLP
jgi:hypothetical protein